MDNRILNTEELQLLKDFIHSRGFRDELVQNEILDHFASKVEEELTDEPRMSIHDAMYAAHQSFGVLGFYAIQANLEKSTRSRYSKLYWQSIKSVFTSIPYMLIVVLSWWLIYKAYLWANTNNYMHVVGRNDVSFILWLGVLASIAYVGFRFRPGNNYYTTMSRQIAFWGIPIVSVLLITTPDSPSSVVPTAILIASVSAIYIILFVAQCRLMEAAAKDYAEFKRIVSQ